jgi:hypothetical protein
MQHNKVVTFNELVAAPLSIPLPMNQTSAPGLLLLLPLRTDQPEVVHARLACLSLEKAFQLLAKKTVEDQEEFSFLTLSTIKGFVKAAVVKANPISIKR